MNKWTPARPIFGVNEDGSLETFDSWSPGPSITATERGAVERAAAWLEKAAQSRGEIHSAGYLCDDAAVLRAMLGRLKVRS